MKVELALCNLCIYHFFIGIYKKTKLFGINNNIVITTAIFDLHFTIKNVQVCVLYKTR